MAAPTWRFKTASGESCDPPPPPEPEPEGLFPALDGSELASFFLCCSAEETRGPAPPAALGVSLVVLLGVAGCYGALRPRRKQRPG